MSPRKITDKQCIQLFHADNPYQILESWGFAPDKAIATLWQIATEPGASSPTNQLINVLLDSYDQASFTHHLALLQRLVARSYEPGYYNHQRREHYHTLLRQMCEHNPQEVQEHLHELPHPYDGLALLELLAHEAIERVPNAAVPALLCWHFQRSWEIHHLLRRTGDIEDYIDSDVWQTQCLAMAQESSILSNSSFPIQLLKTLDRQTLIAIGARQHQPHPALTALLVAQGASSLIPIEEALSQLEGSEGDITQAAGLFPAYLQLLHEAQRPVPTLVVDWLTHEINEIHHGDEHIFDFARWLTLLPTPDAIAIVAQWIRYNHLLQGIFGVIEDPQIFRDVLALWREERPSNWHKKYYAKGFACGGDRAVDAIREALEDKEPGYVVALLSEALKQIDTPGSTRLLLQLLAHSSKSVRQDAIDGLVMRGEQALIGLEEALLSKKKTTREAALQVLTSLKATEARDALIQQVQEQTTDKAIQTSIAAMLSTSTASDDPLHQLQTFANHISEERRAELLAIATGWWTFEEEADKEAMLQRAGLEALLCQDLGQEWRVTQMWKDLLPFYLEDPFAPWVAIYALTQMDRARRWSLRLFREGLDILGTRATEALCALALHGNNQTLLLEQLAKIDAIAGIPVFVKALEASSKGIREVAQEGLRQAGPAAAEALYTALTSSKKSVRLAAAELLKHLDGPATVKALEAAFAAESNADVAALLQAAINHHNSAQQDALGAADTTEAEAFLRETQAIRLPNFLDVEALPSLQWASGAPLSPEATLGWLYQLALEAPGQPNQTARALRQQMAPDALSKFGEHLHELFFANRKPTAYRWLKWQVSICASPSWMYGYTEHRGQVDFLTIAQHGSHISALLLHHYYVAASKRKARELYQEAIDAIPTEYQPTPKERDMFQREQDALTIDQGHCETLQEQDIESGYNATWKLRLLAFPALGELATRVAVDLVSFDLCEGIEPQREPQLLRKAQVVQAQHTAQIELITANMHELIDTQSPQRWSTTGWRMLFVHHPLWRLCGQGLVFATETGEHLMCGADGEPVDALGKAITLEADGFISLVPTTKLSAKERSTWQSQLDQRQLTWQQEQPNDISAQTDSDPLMELRALLSEEATRDNWEAVCHLVESWPEDGTLALGLSYIEAHADEHWGTQQRTPPAHWTLSLLDPKNKMRQKRSREGLLIEDRMQEYLQVCNHLSFPYVDLTVADIKRLANAPYLTQITALEFVLGRWYKGADNALLSQVDFPALRQFALHGTNIREGLWPTLPQTPWLQQLTHLSLRDCTIDWQRLQRLIDGGLLDGLVSLDLQENPIALPGIQLLTSYKGLAGLQELKLSAANLGDDGLAWLAEHSPFEALTALHITAPTYWYNDLRQGAQALAASQRFPRLHTLSATGSDGGWSWRESQQEWFSTLLASKSLPARALESLRAEQEGELARESAEEQAEISGLSDFR